MSHKLRIRVLSLNLSINQHILSELFGASTTNSNNWMKLLELGSYQLNQIALTIQTSKGKCCPSLLNWKDLAPQIFSEIAERE